MEPVKMAKPKIDKPEPSGEDQGAQDSPMQVVAGGIKRWFLVLGLALGILGITAAFLGRLVVASMLVSIFFVSFTLYLFLRFWPEDEVRERSAPPPVNDASKPRRAMVSAVRVDAPPRTRFMIALKDAVRKQDTFRLSPQGAERFARTIRYLLRSSQE